ncbi:aminotransferase [Boletus edulis BED1]|uniref:Aminotransferase n=1 Tax=Boletus edulis BED1 TaxID=1328754 RepID=A0AAD4GJ69_BOLED|nr:aminotransferase [Boletus edulis BED1]
MSLLCTTRFDPRLEVFEWNNAPDGSPSPYLLLAFQLDRLLSSAHLSRWKVSDSLDYTALRDICDNAVRKVNGTDGKTPLKVRVIFPPSGNITASASPVEPLRYDPTAASQFSPDVHTHTDFDPILSICMDTRSTSDTVPMKTTNRQPYDNARARVGIPPVGAPRPHNITPNHPDDVILFNTSGAIMESSVCNVAFHRHGRWLTPPLTVGCIPGVFRRWLLENGRIYEADEHLIALDTIRVNEWVLLFNGVMGCRLGRVYRNRDPSSLDNESH